MINRIKNFWKEIKNYWKEAEELEKLENKKTMKQIQSEEYPYNVKIYNKNLSKKEQDILFKSAKTKGGKMYGSIVIEKLKGGVTYKIYCEMTSPTKHKNKIAYIKLVFPD